MFTSISFYKRLPGDEPGMCPNTQNWLISDNQKPIYLPAAAYMGTPCSILVLT